MISEKLIEASVNSTTPIYIEDVFSTYLYKGTGTTHPIVNNINLADKGGMVWFKNRNNGTPYYQNNYVFDTNRGVNYFLTTNTSDYQQYSNTALNSFNTTGFTTQSDNILNDSSSYFSSWTFRKQAKFFDVVTYTGDGIAGRQIAHNLGSTPGCIIVKQTSAPGAWTGNWSVYHKDIPSGYLWLQSANALMTGAAENVFGNGSSTVSPTSTNFTIGSNQVINASGSTYVAYIFAHNAGGFGLNGTDNVISCGLFTTDASSNATINLGYEPQWILVKNVQTNGTNWFVWDVARGWTTDGNTGDYYLIPNLSDAEGGGADYGGPNATGFNIRNLQTSSNFIYIAIRRGPMKTPTDGTTVFSPATYASYSGFNFSETQNLPDVTPDLTIGTTQYTSTRSNRFEVIDRLRGWGNTGTYGKMLVTNTTSSEANNTIIYQGSSGGVSNTGMTDMPYNKLYYSLKRAPGFFDEVCYTGTGSTRTINHNLGVAPELIIIKGRSSSAYNWAVGAALGTSNWSRWLQLNTDASQSAGGAPWNDTAPTSSVFSISGISGEVNSSGTTYVAYLFASCPGVSKVGYYTGNETSQTINCGFTNGVRFFLVKRTDSNGSWWVFDSARGITSLGDPALQLNSTAAQISVDAVDTTSSGIIVNQESTCNINANGATYMYLAIA